MPDALPERPDLDQLRRRARELRDAARDGDAAALERFARHHPSAPLDVPSLAGAQLVIARELGFASWPALKAAVDARSASRRAVSAFLAASVEGRVGEATTMLGADPGLARRSLPAAAVLGDAQAVREMLAADPGAATAVDDERGWPPLLYASYSCWHRIEPDRVSGLAEVVRLLLHAGASPNTNDGGRLVYRSALKGSVEVNNPAVTEVLLDAGANPDPGQPIGEAIAHRDHRCLQLLLAHGVRVAGTWALGAATYNDDAVAMSLLLDALGSGAAAAATGALCEAAAEASRPVVAALLDAGADPAAIDGAGVSAHRLAVRAGRSANAARLREAGASDDATDADRFLGACRDGDRRRATALLYENPDLPSRLTEHDRAAIFDAAAFGPSETVAVMLDLGFSADIRNASGEQPLHTAAYHGNAAAVQVLLAAGADVDARDSRFDATPLAFATVGSGERVGLEGDWIESVRLLLAAGASREGVWVPEKPPSEEVIDLLSQEGIGPEEPTVQPDEDDGADAPGSIGTGVMADVARHLEAAYVERDLDLLASLLHPEVHWTGLCTDKAQVLDWYRGLAAEGTIATVHSVEVDRDAVVLGLAVARQAEGARPAPPQELFQVFSVEDAQIVDIRAYPDRHSALTRL